MFIEKIYVENDIREMLSTHFVDHHTTDLVFADYFSLGS